MTPLSNGLGVDPSYCRCVPMKPDIDDPIGIIDPHPNAILVAGDVEHRTAGLENARAANGSLHVRCRRPVSSSDLLFGVYDVGPIPWITVGTTNLGGLATVHLADP